MTRRFLAVVSVAAAVVAATIGGVTLAQGSSSTKATPAAHKGAKVSARRHHRVSVHRTARSAQAGNDQADNEQSGKDKADNEQSDNEQPGSETPDGDGPGGHADEPTNASADHEAQGAE